MKGHGSAQRERADFAAMAMVVAEEAAALLLSGYRSRPRADKKGRTDLVTEFDRRSEALILSRLTSLSPDIPIVAEESAPGPDPAASGRSAKPSLESPITMADPAPIGRPGLVWYVDPLDGTTNYVHGHPFYSVAIGLMEDDAPIVGVVVAP